MTNDSGNGCTKIDETFVAQATAAVTGTSVKELTRFEQSILDQLAEAKGEIVSKAEIADRLYPNGKPPSVNSNTIEVFVGRLRRKLGEKSIATIRGRGYQLKAKIEQPAPLAAAS